MLKPFRSSRRQTEEDTLIVKAVEHLKLNMNFKKMAKYLRSDGKNLRKEVQEDVEEDFKNYAAELQRDFRLSKATIQAFLSASDSSKILYLHTREKLASGYRAEREDLVNALMKLIDPRKASTIELEKDFNAEFARLFTKLKDDENKNGKQFTTKDFWLKHKVRCVVEAWVASMKKQEVDFAFKSEVERILREENTPAHEYLLAVAAEDSKKCLAKKVSVTDMSVGLQNYFSFNNELIIFEYGYCVIGSGKRTYNQSPMKFAMKLKENEVWFKSRPLAHEVDMLIKLRGNIYFPELFAYGRYSDGKTNYEAYVMESLLASVERAYSNNRNNIAVPLSTEVVSSILLLMAEAIQALHEHNIICCGISAGDFKFAKRTIQNGAKRARLVLYNFGNAAETGDKNVYKRESSTCSKRGDMLSALKIAAALTSGEYIHNFHQDLTPYLNSGDRIKVGKYASSPIYLDATINAFYREIFKLKREDDPKQIIAKYIAKFREGMTEAQITEWLSGFYAALKD